jgi:predicted GH43/DUF377 family glycosyl hydrolase
MRMQEMESTMIKFERMGVLLSPDKEDQAKFNAGMIEFNGEVHMLYRFCEKIAKWRGKTIDWSQCEEEFPYGANYICYAKLNLDGSLQSDLDEKVIVPEHPFELYGCEDPRIVRFEDAFYLFYTAYDLKKARVAVAKTLDFKHYEKLGFIDNFASDKDAFIFPERIHHKIAYMHRISTTIQIDYFDSIEDMLSPESWEGYEQKVDQQVVIKGIYAHESQKIGGGVPPIKTDKGWLILYHGVDDNRKYHVGAALLDLNNPSQEIARLPYPVLSPEADFEISGDYNGCVFPQGYYLHDGYIYISYGTADKYTALAKIQLDALLDELEQAALDPKTK